MVGWLVGGAGGWVAWLQDCSNTKNDERRRAIIDVRRKKRERSLSTVFLFLLLNEVEIVPGCLVQFYLVEDRMNEVLRVMSISRYG